MAVNKDFDVIVIGGSYAGLSFSMALRNTLVIDNGIPCNIKTPHSHNFITQDTINQQPLRCWHTNKRNNIY